MIPWRAFSGGSLQTLTAHFFFFCWVDAQAESGNWWLGMLARLEGYEGWEGRNDAVGTWRKTWARKRNISQGFKNCVCSSVHNLTQSPSLQQIFSESQCELLMQLALLLDLGQNLYIRLKTENWSSLWEAHNLWMTSGVKAHLPMPSLPGSPPW